MRQPFFESKYLGKVLYVKDIQDLNKTDLNTLDRELSAAIASMKEKMHEERDTSELNWLHKLSVKLKICEQFLARVCEVRDNEISKIEAYHFTYFRQAVANAIGPLRADELLQQAKEEAIQQINMERKL
jgi:hypothetical protein|tara:strand:+ start:2398 stop:2784 length:387 start_codon:yes stop_codon:yes gene_type:complete